MILSTSLSPALLHLLKTEIVLIDAIKVGLWFSVEESRQYQVELLDWQDFGENFVKGTDVGIF